MGHGSTSVVYLAEHISLGVYRAIKRISKTHIAYHQLMKEVHILKSLKHPNIPIVYDIEEDQNYSYIIEEYLQGESLKAYRLRLSNIDERSVLDFTFQICDLIQYLHTFDTGILYLDLKPENILIDKGKLKLLDFGAALYADQYNKAEQHLGTMAYMAPERVSNRADQRSDIYSIGCLLYFLVTGTLYQPSGVSGKWMWIFIRNHRFYRLIERCLRTEPSRRFQSVSELEKEVFQLQRTGELNKKKAVMSYHVAIAGSESGIGVTHVALVLSRYIAQISQSSVYIEWNKDGFLHNGVTSCPEIKERDGFFWLEHVRMQTKENWEQLDMQERFHFQIKDYGVLTQDNLQEFLMEEHPMLILGIKPWEWKASMSCLDLLCDCEHVLLLFRDSEGAFSRSFYRKLCVSAYEVIPYLAYFENHSFRSKERKFLDSVVKYVVTNQGREVNTFHHKNCKQI